MHTRNYIEKKTSVRALFALLAFCLLLGSCLPRTAYAKLEPDELSAVCEEIDLWRSVVEAFPAGNPQFTGPYQFWWGNLDGDAERELIVAATDASQFYAQTLFVYDLKEENGTKTPTLLFTEAPPVQIRYGFSGTEDGQGTLYSYMTAMSTGTFSVGTVTLDPERTRLVYTKTDTFSMAKNESFPFKTQNISGTYDPDSAASTDWGPLEVEPLASQELVLGQDNNSYHHANDDKGLGGLDYYAVTPQQYADLVDGASIGTIGSINDSLNSQGIGGVCFGIAAMMGLVKNGTLSPSAFEPGAETYFDLPAPNQSQALFNELCYLYLSQHLMEDEDYAALIRPGRSGWEKEDLEQFLNALRSDTPQMLAYFYEDKEGHAGGHGILVKDTAYYSFPGVYDVTLYDMNSVTDQTPQGSFYHLYIQDDFSAFSLPRSSGAPLTQEEVTELQLINVDTVWQKVSGQDHSDVDSLDAIFEVNYKCWFFQFSWSPLGDGIQLENGQITGDTQEVSEKASTASDRADGATEAARRLAVPKSDRYTLAFDPAQPVDISLNTGSAYYAIEGQGIQSVTLSAENGIEIDGSDYTFSAGLTLVQDGHAVYAETQGSGHGPMAVAPADGVLRVSAETPMHIDRFSVAADGTPTQYSIGRNTTSLTWAQNGAPQVEGSVPWGLILGSAAVLCLALAGLWFWKKRRASSGSAS